MTGRPQMPSSERSSGAPCREVQRRLESLIVSRDLAAASALSDFRTALPDPLRSHMEGCAECQRACADALRLDALLSGHYVETRGGIGDPSAARMELILRGASERSPDAQLLEKVRRTVRRMLWFTLLLLAALPLLALAWWLVTILRNVGKR